MKNFTFIFLFFCFSIQYILAQDKRGKFDLEISKLNIGVSSGLYKGRTSYSNNGLTASGQIYFPFRCALDYEGDFTKTSINEYDERIFLIRPSIILQSYEDIAYGFGLANQLSWLITKSFYLEYQLGVVYNEATKAAQPDIYSGFSLHHYASISKPLSKHLTIHVGYSHLSNAGIIQGDNSIIDAFLAGIRYNTH